MRKKEKEQSAATFT